MACLPCIPHSKDLGRNMCLKLAESAPSEPTGDLQSMPVSDATDKTAISVISSAAACW